MRTGIADLPLHGGKAPQWLMQRMIRLARAVIELMAEEFGTEYVLQRLADPFWFQAFGCLLGFDWHSSGLTTTVCGAIKAAIQSTSAIPLVACGGKGASSRKTPDEIRAASEQLAMNPEPLIYASRMAAKIDNAALQDGFQLYHHSFFFDHRGNWAVVQQGMAQENDVLGKPNAGFARRYHWLSTSVQSWTLRPEAAICSEKPAPLVVDTAAPEAYPMQQVISHLLKEEPQELHKLINKMPYLRLSERHRILLADIHPHRINRILLSAYEQPPGDFADLISTPGIGPATLRALALAAEIVYGHGPSYSDPARYSFAHGGKDGTPYPVNRKTYDHTIEVLNRLVSGSRIDLSEKRAAFRRLARLANPSCSDMNQSVPGHLEQRSGSERDLRAGFANAQEL